MNVSRVKPERGGRGAESPGKEEEERLGRGLGKRTGPIRSRECVDGRANLSSRSSFANSNQQGISGRDKKVVLNQGTRLIKHIQINSADFKATDLIKELKSRNLKTSIDRVATNVLFQKLSAGLVKSKEKKEHKRAATFRENTFNCETAILWRDDIQLEVEEELTISKCIGQGSFAKVYEGFDKILKKTVAIKVIDKKRIIEQNRKQMIQSEVNILALMKHKHIVEFYRIVEDQKRLYLVMELCGSSTLNSFCRKFPNRRLSEKQAQAIFNQIAKAIQHLHDQGVAHRDLKLSNILIDQRYTAKIIDFGFACQAADLQKVYCGTPSYMSPEIVEKKAYYGRPADIWSIGVLLFTMVCGQYPFGGKQNLWQRKKVQN